MTELEILIGKEQVSIALQDDFLKVADLVSKGEIETAHLIAQKREGNFEADLWHGIIHRLEGDAPNAKYWFRRSEPLWQELGLNPIELTNQRDEAKEAHEWRVLTTHGLARLGIDVT